MLVFDHLNSSLPTIFDDLFKPCNEQHTRNTRGASRYVLNIRKKLKTVKRGHFDQRDYFDHIQIYKCNCSKNKNYKIKSPLSL